MSYLSLASRKIQGKPFGFFHFYTTHVTIRSAINQEILSYFRQNTIVIYAFPRSKCLAP